MVIALVRKEELRRKYRNFYTNLLGIFFFSRQGDVSLELINMRKSNEVWMATPVGQHRIGIRVDTWCSCEFLAQYMAMAHVVTWTGKPYYCLACFK